VTDSFMDQPEEDQIRIHSVDPTTEPEGLLYVQDLLRVDGLEQNLHSLHEMTEEERRELHAACETIRVLIDKVRQRAPQE